MNETEIRRTAYGWSLFEKGETIVGSDGLIASADSYDDLVALANSLISDD